MLYQWVPHGYYDTPLEERAKELGSEPEQLCKTMIMENKAFDEVWQTTKAPHYRRFLALCALGGHQGTTLSFADARNHSTMTI